MAEFRKKVDPSTVTTYRINDIAKELSEQTRVSYNDCRYLVNAIFGIMKGMIEAGSIIKIQDFGKFYPRISPAEESKEGYVHSFDKSKQGWGIVPSKASFLAPGFQFSNVWKAQIKEATLGIEGEQFDENGKFIK